MLWLEFKWRANFYLSSFSIGVVDKIYFPPTALRLCLLFALSSLFQFINLFLSFLLKKIYTKKQNKGIKCHKYHQ